MQSVPCAALVLLVNIRALLVALDIALRCRSFACRGPRGRHYCVELDSTLESCPVLMTYMDNKQIGTPVGGLPIALTRENLRRSTRQPSRPTHQNRLRRIEVYHVSSDARAMPRLTVRCLRAWKEVREDPRIRSPGARP